MSKWRYDVDGTLSEEEHEFEDGLLFSIRKSLSLMTKSISHNSL